MKSDLIFEIWKPIPGFVGLYEASTFGRVKSLHGKSKILKPHIVCGNYQQIRLCKNGKQEWFLIHRLIWETFNGSIPEDYEINHIDERPWNNAVWNLSLMTHNENINFGTRNRKVSEKLSYFVYQYTLDGSFIKKWNSIQEINKELGFHTGAISLCCRNRQKSHKGFIWSYAPLNNLVQN